MKKFSWNPEKSQQLKDERGVSFEDIVFHILVGDVLAVYDHPNQERYAGQKVYHVLIDDYVFLVPFLESATEVFLKTIIPSRKATRQHSKGEPRE